MDFLVNSQFEQMCRTCMGYNPGNSTDDNVQLHSLFDYVDDYKKQKIQIFEILNETVKQLPKIEIMDALPKSLCTQCVEKLCTFYEFQNCCINSDIRLRQAIAASFVYDSAEKKTTDPLQSDIQNSICEVEDFIKHEIEEHGTEELNQTINEGLENSPVHDSSYDAAITDNDGDNIRISREQEGSWNCEVCEKQFLYKRNLIRHIKRTHNIESSVTKRARKIKEKTSGVEVSEDERTLCCKICEKIFLHKKNLKRHMKCTHNIETPTKLKAITKITDTSKKKKLDDFKHEEDTKTDTNMELNLIREEQADVEKSDQPELTSKEFENKKVTPENSIVDVIFEDNSEIKRVYLCEICDVEFSYKKNLKRHYKQAHDYEMSKDMEYVFDSVANAERKSKVKPKTNDRIWHCEICKTQFLYKRNLQRHMRRTHNEESPIEIKTGIDVSAFVKTEAKTNSESSEEEWNIPIINIWTCERCQKKFTFKKNLKRHMKRIHNEELPIDTKAENGEENNSNVEEAKFKCNECDSVFHKKVYLRKHKYRHKQPGGLKRDKRNCIVCGIACKTLQNLREHYSSAHPEHLESNGNQLPESLKLYVCQYCNKSFQQSCTLKDHIRVHTKEQPFLCSHCGKAFNSNSNLRQHVLRHETEKRYECPECPKKFPCLSDLASHKQVHKQLKPHVCDICGAAFGKPFQLKTHKMYHNGEKRYQCEYCAMRFVCGDHLRRHIRTHTGEKPYKCKFCSRSFSQSNDMIKHLRIHLGENVYQCELCPAAFRLASELRTHFALHKNDDEETRERNKRAWHEAQEQLKLKLESDQATPSRARKNSMNSNSLLAQAGHFLFSLNQQV